MTSSPSSRNKRKSTDHGCLNETNSDGDGESKLVSNKKKQKLSDSLSNHSESDEDQAECSEMLVDSYQITHSSSSSMDSNDVLKSGNLADKHYVDGKNIPDCTASSTGPNGIPESKSSESVSTPTGRSVGEVAQRQLSIITASQTGDLDTIRRLVSECQTDINESDDKGQTALHIASEKG
eukprot:766083_1